jgi:hypothetical protein
MRARTSMVTDRQQFDFQPLPSAPGLPLLTSQTAPSGRPKPRVHAAFAAYAMLTGGCLGHS